MTLRHSFLTAVRGLRTNKSRSLLTILGIVIGITGIILMVSMGDGAQELILNQIGGLGAETIVIRPGKEPKGITDVGGTIFADSLKPKDVKALLEKSNAPHLVKVMPALIVPGSVSYDRETYQPTILGGEVSFFSDTFNIYVAKGIPFDDTDISQRASVAVIGSKVERELFAGSDGVGEYITIRGRKFRVVGIFPPRGQSGFFNFDELVIVPYTTAQTYLLGIDHYHEIITKAENAEYVAKTVKDIELTLRESHGITDAEDDDFFVVTQQGVVDQIRTIMGALTAFLSSVVAIALVVGGIGVMNIMLVSVTERTREIGLRKALGATDRDILLQFLLEAILLTGIGGLVGILLGTLFSFAATLILTNYVGLDWVFVFPVYAAILGMGMSACVGLVFGIYPARQASKESPIEALRYE